MAAILSRGGWVYWLDASHEECKNDMMFKFSMCYEICTYCCEFLWLYYQFLRIHINGLIQEGRNSIALELRLSCTNLLIWWIYPWSMGCFTGTEAILCLLQCHMMTSSIENIFRVTGHLCGEFTGHRWFPHTKASDTELWCFLWSAPK